MRCLAIVLQPSDHTANFSDFCGAMREVWGELVPRARASAKSVPQAVTEVPTSRAQVILQRSKLPAFVLTGVSAIVLGITNYFDSVTVQLDLNKAFIADVMDHGTQGTARVSHRQFWRPMGQTSYPVQRFDFSYQTPTGGPRPAVQITEVHGNPHMCCQLFDSEALLADFRPHHDLDEAFDFSVKIAYLPEISDKVAIPRYPPTVTEIPWYFDLISLLLYGIFGVGLMGMLGLLASMKLFELLVSKPLAEDRSPADAALLS